MGMDQNEILKIAKNICGCAYEDDKVHIYIHRMRKAIEDYFAETLSNKRHVVALAGALAECQISEDSACSVISAFEKRLTRDGSHS